MSPLIIWQGKYSIWEYFDGFLDDVKISINNDDNYFAYYDFNDGEGQILSDITGNNDAMNLWSYMER